MLVVWDVVQKERNSRSATATEGMAGGKEDSRSLHTSQSISWALHPAGFCALGLDWGGWRGYALRWIQDSVGSRFRLAVGQPWRGLPSEAAEWSTEAIPVVQVRAPSGCMSRWADGWAGESRTRRIRLVMRW